MHIPGYDAWRLQGPPDTDAIGIADGETCNRYPEPDEDAPRGYRPRPCDGIMEEVDGWAVCGTCGAVA